jgi:hypothetical protein
MRYAFSSSDAELASSGRESNGVEDSRAAAATGDYQ